MDKIDELLIKHRILPGYKGYSYIKYILKNEKQDISNMKIINLYNKVAEEFNTTGSRVERCLRHIFSKSDLIGKVNKVKLALLQIEYQGENYD